MSAQTEVASRASPSARGVVAATGHACQDRYWNLLAVNEATRRVFGYGATDRNCLVVLHQQPLPRHAHLHWAAAAPGWCPRSAPMRHGIPTMSEFAEIVDDLGAVSPEFVELWERHDAGHHSQAIKAVLHPPGR